MVRAERVHFPCALQAERIGLSRVHALPLGIPLKYRCWWPPFPPHYAIFGRTKGRIFKSFSRVLKFPVWLLRRPPLAWAEFKNLLVGMILDWLVLVGSFSFDWAGVPLFCFWLVWFWLVLFCRFWLVLFLLAWFNYFLEVFGLADMSRVGSRVAFATKNSGYSWATKRTKIAILNFPLRLLIDLLHRS